MQSRRIILDVTEPEGFRMGPGISPTGTYFTDNVRIHTRRVERDFLHGVTYFFNTRLAFVQTLVVQTLALRQDIIIGKQGFVALDVGNNYLLNSTLKKCSIVSWPMN